MKKEEVPQDKSNLEEHNIKELCYAVDGEGKYTTVLSTGWEAKTIVQKETIKGINERINDTKKAVAEEKISPIAYFMEVHKMDLNILSSYLGMQRWRVKRHLKPKVFRKLSTKTLERYSRVFEISIGELEQFDGK